jgi:hypothetical protein
MILPADSRATIVLPLDLQRLVDVFLVAFIGHVVNVYTEGQAKPMKIETVIHIEVNECLIGSCKAVFVLKQRGGSFNFAGESFTQFVSGMPTFKPGERVVLFLEKTDSNRLVVTGLAQGKFSVSDETASAVLSRDLGGLNFVDAHTKQPVHVHGLIGMPARLDVLRSTLIKGQSILDLRPVSVPEHENGGAQ